MKKRKLYLYNPETDNFERFYPTLRDRARLILATLLVGILLASGFYLVFFYIFETPTVENLTAENERLRNTLRTQREEVIKRLDYSMDVMRAIRERDSNLYRMMMQMDSISPYVMVSEKVREENSRRLKKVNDSRLLSSLMMRLDTLNEALLRQSLSFSQIIAAAQEDRDKLKHIPSVLPIHLDSFTMSSGFGRRIDPSYDVPKFHSGIDMVAEEGTPIYATADGEVETTGREKIPGNYVTISHGFDYATSYHHLSEVMVYPGQKVKRGEMIGRVGSTGKSFGPHLHYEVMYKGEPQNPVDYYFMDLTPEQYDEMTKQAANAGRVMD